MDYKKIIKSRKVRVALLNALNIIPDKPIVKLQYRIKFGRKLNLKNSIILLIGCALGVFGYKLILDYLGGNSTLLDSSSTIISVIANTLMLLRYREQWLLWIIIDTITVIMWLVAGDLIMVTMWLVYLINAFYGYYNWTKMSKED